MGVSISTLFASDSVAGDAMTPSQRVLAESHDANRRRLPGNGIFKSKKDDGITSTVLKNVFYYPLAGFIYGVEGTLSGLKNGTMWAAKKSGDWYFDRKDDDKDSD